MSKKEKKRNWHLTPEETDRLPYFSQEDWDKVLALEETKHLLPKRLPRPYTPSVGSRIKLRLFWQPASITCGAGLPGLALIVSQLWLLDLAVAMGWSLGIYLGFIRLAMIILGGWLLFYAAPSYRTEDWTIEQQQRLNEDRDYFLKKRRL